jgi:hypothetical protein
MIIGSRQTKFDALDVPEIKRWETNIKFDRYFESLKKELLKALSKKFTHGSKVLFEDSIKQTLNFLITVGALKDFNKIVSKIELWKEFIQLEPLYEGIALQLKTMLIKHHFPNMYKEMSKGQAYSHDSLTMIKEAVLYTMEYLQKDKMLKPQKEFLANDGLKNKFKKYTLLCNL